MEVKSDHTAPQSRHRENRIGNLGPARKKQATLCQSPACDIEKDHLGKEKDKTEHKRCQGIIKYGSSATAASAYLVLVRGYPYLININTK